MWIKELTTHQSLEVLSHTHLGRLACARGMQPYVIPIRFAYKDQWLYSFSGPGQKIAWMRANPLVCVEADQLRREQWASVVVMGRYVELCDTPEFQSVRTFAFNLLQQQIAMWWEHGGVKKTSAGVTAADPIFYRIKLEQITGRCGFSEQAVHDVKQAGADLDEQEWLLKLFRSVRQT